MNNLPLVSIVIPCRNEEGYIDKCLDSIINNDYPKKCLEVIVVDGLSTDRTREILEGYSERYPFIRILENPKKVTPIAMNLGIKNAKGDVVIILGCHSTIDSNFVAKSVEHLTKTDADCVGGLILTKSNNSFMGKVISLALSSFFGVGNSMFRIGTNKPMYVDTVPFGAYRREVFDRIGFFDEELVRNQDDELNFRLLKEGGKILLVPEIISYYYPRDKLLKLWRQHFQYGYWKVRVAQKVGAIFTWRQLVPGIFVGSLIFCLFFSLVSKIFLFILSGIVSLYIAVNLGFSLHLSLKNKLRFVFVLPVVFATLHFSYGLGFLKGVFDFVILKKHLKKQIKDTPLTR